MLSLCKIEKVHVDKHELYSYYFNYYPNFIQLQTSKCFKHLTYKMIDKIDTINTTAQRIRNPITNPIILTIIIFPPF